MVTAAAAQVLDNQYPKLFFVRDEICVVCSTDCAVDDERREAIYEAVRVRLNRMLASLFSPDRVAYWEERDGVEGFKRYLTVSPAERAPLRDRFQDDQLFWPLARRRGGASLLFDRCDGSTTHLHFYQVGDSEKNKEIPPERRDRHIRQLTLFINSEFAARPDGKSAIGGWQILAVTPSWLAGASGEHGSPAAPPVPIKRPRDGQTQPPKQVKSGDNGETGQPPTPNWQFRFDSDPSRPKPTQLQAMVENDRNAARQGTRSNVIVAVLDTCPAWTVVKDAADAFPYNSLLQQVVGPKDLTGQYQRGSNWVWIDGALSLPANDFESVEGILPDWKGYLGIRAGGNIADEYLMPDHGLFATGIVKDIAPSTAIHLIRVMNDYGMAGLFNVAAILNVLPNTLLRGPADPRRLIVNLSLTFSVPTFDEFLEEWLSDVARDIERDPAILGRFLSDLCAARSIIHRSLGEVIDWLEEKNVLVVAAAGNYNVLGIPRPEPRFPAYYDNVFGVAALSREERPASYSNLGEENIVHSPNGIATLGGDTVTSSNVPDIAHQRLQAVEGEYKPKIQLEQDEEPDAIRGIFSAVYLPIMERVPANAMIGGGTNETGWVYWVGTSFATPIITAIAAIVWNSQPKRSPGWVINAVQSLADIPQPSLNCDGIHAYQVSI